MLIRRPKRIFIRQPDVDPRRPYNEIRCGVSRNTKTEMPYRGRIRDHLAHLTIRHCQLRVRKASKPGYCSHGSEYLVPVVGQLHAGNMSLSRNPKSTDIDFRRNMMFAQDEWEGTQKSHCLLRLRYSYFGAPTTDPAFIKFRSLSLTHPYLPRLRGAGESSQWERVIFVTD